MNFFIEFFDILSNDLSEGFRNQKLHCIIPELFFYFWDYDEIEGWLFITKLSRFFVSYENLWKIQILLLSIFVTADIMEIFLFLKKSHKMTYIHMEFRLEINPWFILRVKNGQNRTDHIFRLLRPLIKWWLKMLKILQICSSGYKNLQNFTWFIMKFYNRHHTINRPKGPFNN